jgi:phosphoribosylaminoimidazolecarboxamide formyltransferase/IMP cyclohydrolase
VEDDSLWKDLILAWAVGCTSNSNTITLASDCMVMANAVSQQSRIAAVFLAKLKAERANIVTQGCVAYSDSFFPFDDAVKLLHSMRVRAILTSKAGVRFEDVGRYCIENGIILYAAPDAMIRGFFGH